VGDEIWTPDHRHVRVIDLLPIDDEGSRYSAALRVELM
jgi:hypothetical protein